jgi:hypothetical protein
VQGARPGSTWLLDDMATLRCAGGSHSSDWTRGASANNHLPLQSFADPMNNNKPFNYPANTGISFSFTDDGYFEEAQYRFNSNGSSPLLFVPLSPSPD